MLTRYNTAPGAARQAILHSPEKPGSFATPWTSDDGLNVNGEGVSFGVAIPPFGPIVALHPLSTGPTDAVSAAALKDMVLRAADQSATGTARSAVTLIPHPERSRGIFSPGLPADIFKSGWGAGNRSKSDQRPLEGEWFPHDISGFTKMLALSH